MCRGDGVQFDRGCAAAALGSADIFRCFDANGPRGTGHVKVTFAPTGAVASVELDGGPFPETATGACIQAAYRALRISPFEGGAVTVGKTFRLP